MDDYPANPLDFDLGHQLDFDGKRIAKPWLIDIHPSEVHLAGGTPDLQFDRTAIYLGDRPIALDLHRLSVEALKGRIASSAGNVAPTPGSGGPSDAELLKQVQRIRPYWKYYLVLYGLGIQHYDRRLREVGLQITYKEDANTPVTVMDYWPKSRDENIVEAESSINADLDIHGRLSTSSTLIDPILRTIPLPIGGEVKIGGRGKFFAQISAKLALPVVESFGCYSTSTLWTFHRQQSQQLVMQVIQTQADVSEVAVTATVNAIYGGVFETRATEEQHVSLSLKLREPR